jgi:hypothetical protein
MYCTLHQESHSGVLRQIKIIVLICRSTLYELKEGIRATRSTAHIGPGWAKRQRLTRTGEARIRLRDRPRDDLHRATLDASLRFSRGRGAKSSCEVKNV